MLTNADVKKYIDKRLEDGAIRGPGGTSNRDGVLLLIWALHERK